MEKFNFLSTIPQTLNRRLPEKKLVINENTCPWINREIKNFHRRRDHAQKMGFV